MATSVTLANLAAAAVSSYPSRVAHYGNREKQLAAMVKTYVDALSPDTIITTRGDIIISDATGDATRLAKGTAGQVLSMGANDPAWSSAPAIVGGSAIELTAFSVRDENVAYDLVVQSDDASMAADRILSIDVNNAARRIDLSGDLTIAGDVSMAGSLTTLGAWSQVGAYSLEFTTTGATAVTLPTSGTLISTTAPALVGGSHIECTGLSVRDQGVAFDLEFQSNDATMAADRILTFNVNNAARSIDLADDLAVSASSGTIDQSVAAGASPAFTSAVLTTPIVTTGGSIDVSGAGTLAIGASMGANALSLGSATGSVACIGATVDVTGVLNVDDTTDGSAIGTASAVVDGGLSVAKKLYCGEPIYLEDNTTAGEFLVIQSVGDGGSVMSDDRTLSIDVYDAARTIDLQGNLDLGGNFVTDAAVEFDGQYAVATGTLSQANILAMNGAPVEAIAAPAAGSSIVVDEVEIFHDYSTAAYANGGDFVLEYGGGGDIVQWAETIVTGGADDYTLIKPSVYDLDNSGAATVGFDLDAVDNSAVNFTNEDAAFINGNAANIIKYKIKYHIVTRLT